MAKRFSSKRGPSQRQLRAGELIRHALVDIFQREDWREPALDGVSITVSEVRASPDLKNATVFCAPLGASVSDAPRESGAFITALNRLAPQIRHLLGQKIEMKFTPALSFQNDASFAEASRIDALLASPAVQRDLPAEGEDDDA
ncbi:MAG: 30S ribosome-binding factor RbfA [Pseudomonadota bacterium]